MPKSTPRFPRTSPGFRLSKRPTIPVDTFADEHIKETVMGVFREAGLMSIDLDALIHLTLKNYTVTPKAYRSMAVRVREVILKNYAIEPGELIVPHERPHRRLTVCFTVEEGQE